ncbi:hypothetical protein [Rhodococcus sp. JS3073]|uniref:hypothetical protein n=1 Tax=Rhodococcus sp. JS3073 TaxID=3002901 RepID=UPI0022855312|nr:hypothetical protein [Rhodococcus sp. JS3073]WAM19507.1 hypothetical protein OYT95_38160 [Rhodococcus sp. JS3073]
MTITPAAPSGLSTGELTRSRTAPGGDSETVAARMSSDLDEGAHLAKPSEY